MVVFAGIVLYNPDILRLQQSLKRLESQVNSIVIVDNASSNVSEVDSLVKTLTNVKLIKNDENQGIATALNEICSCALKEQAEWVLTLDQDTVCEESMISQLIEYSSINGVGILCPDVDYEGLDIHSSKDSKELTQVRACMTSGSLTNIKAWKEVGGFRDDFFIDFVDNDFCMRLEISQYRILRVNTCIMHHQLGEGRDINVIGSFKKRVCIHRPWRFYYMTRNNLVFIWDYKSRLNLIKEYLKFGKILLQGIVYSDKKNETISFIISGFKDAIKHKMGKMK